MTAPQIAILTAYTKVEYPANSRDSATQPQMIYLIDFIVASFLFDLFKILQLPGLVVILALGAETYFTNSISPARQDLSKKGCSGL